MGIKVVEVVVDEAHEALRLRGLCRDCENLPTDDYADWLDLGGEG